MLYFPYLELQLHASDVLAALHLRELLDVRIQAPGGHFGVPAGHRLQQRVVNEAVLVLGLHHVVPLRSHECHMAINVHRLLVLDALEHGVDDDEAARPPDARAGAKLKKNKEEIAQLFFFFPRVLLIFSPCFWH